MRHYAVPLLAEDVNQGFVDPVCEAGVFLAVSGGRCDDLPNIRCTRSRQPQQSSPTLSVPGLMWVLTTRLLKVALLADDSGDTASG